MIKQLATSNDRYMFHCDVCDRGWSSPYPLEKQTHFCNGETPVRSLCSRGALRPPVMARLERALIEFYEQTPHNSPWDLEAGLAGLARCLSPCQNLRGLTCGIFCRRPCDGLSAWFSRLLAGGCGKFAPAPTAGAE